MKNQDNGIAIISSQETIWFDSSNPADEKRAWMAAFNMTSEKYDEVKEKSQKRIEEFNNKYPFLKNLHCINEEMYYTDDSGNRIETQKALELVSDSLKGSMRKLLKDAS